MRKVELRSDDTKIAQKCGVWKKAVRSVKCGRWSGVKCGVLRAQCEVKCGVRRAQCEVWSVECEAWSVECEECSEKCEVRSVKREVWSVRSAVRSVKCKAWSVKREVWSVKSSVRSVKCEVWSVKSAVRSVKCEVELQMWHVKQDATLAECTHARAWLAHGACKFYRWERSYISLRQLPPRLVRTTGILCLSTRMMPLLKSHCVSAHSVGLSKRLSKRRRPSGKS